MTPTRLLAKSSYTPDKPLFAQTLAGHLHLVGQVATQLVEDAGEAIISALGLQAEAWTSLLAHTAMRGAYLHDIGKANGEFQRMVRQTSRVPQALKHEPIAVWMLAAYPDLDNWLFAGQPTAVRCAALRAIASHHLRFRPVQSLQPASAGVTSIEVYAGHPDFAEVLRLLGAELGLATPPSLRSTRMSLLDDVSLASSSVGHVISEWNPGSEGCRFAAAVAAIVVAADIVGSALIRDGHDPANWARESIKIRCDGDDLQRAADRRLAGAPPRQFQTEVADSRARLTLALAGCGTGKTVAAYLWAAQRLTGKKMFFCYPTTGTATEGFLDYAYPEFEDDADLVHSRSTYDVENILGNGQGDDEHGATDTAMPYRGLGLWTAKLTVCTADAVLGLIQNNKTGLCGFPALVNGGFVFDEVHLYDDRMFGCLLAFIEAMRGAPMLLMTATLQPGRLAALRQLAARLGEPLTEVTGPPALEHMPRYRIHRADLDEARAAAEREVQQGGRVLWVVNTVDRAIEIARDLEGRGLNVEPYHSRYRYCDRLVRHRAVVDAFRPGGERAVVAVTTQVCEVSLDISAGLLVTEVAPPSSLIQRLGRLNRWATPNDCEPKPALVLEPRNPLPYAAEALAASRDWLADVSGRDVSQSDLHAAFVARLTGQPIAERTPSEWLDEPFPHAGPVREAGATVSVIRAEDEAAVLVERRSQRDGAAAVVKYSIPMTVGPVARDISGWRQLGLARIAPEGRMSYDPRWGAKWQR